MGAIQGVLPQQTFFSSFPFLVTLQSSHPFYSKLRAGKAVVELIASTVGAIGGYGSDGVWNEKKVIRFVTRDELTSTG